MNIDQLLKSKKLIVCAGTGGVGKTSLSCALAYRAALLGKKSLVLTIDPAKRLKTALGLNDISNDKVEFQLEATSGSFSAAIVNAKKVFDDFVRQASPDEESTNLLLNNLLYKKLSMGLQGSQEFTSLEKLYQEYRSNNYDIIILDTPPAQHAIDFLNAPEHLNKLFDEKILKWFVGEKESKSGGLLRRVAYFGTRKAFGVLDKLTGAEFVNAIFDFFVSMKFIRAELVRHTQRVNEILHSADASFVLVTAYDDYKLKQSIEFYNQLKEKNFDFGALIVNRCIPTNLVHSKDDKWKEFYIRFLNHYEKEEALFNKLKNQFSTNLLKLKVLEIPQMDNGLESIKILNEQLGE